MLLIRHQSLKSQLSGKVGGSTLCLKNRASDTKVLLDNHIVTCVLTKGKPRCEWGEPRAPGLGTLLVRVSLTANTQPSAVDLIDGLFLSPFSPTLPSLEEFLGVTVSTDESKTMSVRGRYGRIKGLDWVDALDGVEDQCYATRKETEYPVKSSPDFLLDLGTFGVKGPVLLDLFRHSYSFNEFIHLFVYS